MNNLVIIGAGGHGKVIADIAKNVGYNDIVFLDDDKTVKTCGGYSVVGVCADALRYSTCDFAVGIGKAEVRKRIQEDLIKKGFRIVSLVHPNAVVASNVKIGIGTVVMAGAVVNSCTEIGKGCIVNTCASVDHDCRIGDYVHISVGSHVAGTVTIGENTFVGAGVIVSNNVKIVKNCIIGAGAVVVKNLEKSSIYIGVPAKMKCNVNKTLNAKNSGGADLTGKRLAVVLNPVARKDSARRVA